MKVILIVGNCGTGKTWIMKQLIADKKLFITGSAGKYQWISDGKTAVLGKYGRTKSGFEGSDALSMSIMSDNEKAREALANHDVVICEGDRFMNSTFIKAFSPFIIKIEGDGYEGRILRGSNQTERHLKAIQTRVLRSPYDITLKNSADAYEYLKTKLKAAK